MRKFAEPFGERNSGAEVELLGCSGGRCDDMTDIAQTPLAGDDRRWSARCHDLPELLRQVGDGARRATGHVERSGHVCTRTERGHVGPGDVGHMHEIPSLSAVLKDAWCLTSVQRAEEQAGYPGVGGVDGSSWSVDVVVPKCDHRGSCLAPERRAQMLLMHLGGGVDVAGVECGVLVDRGPRQVRAARPAGRLERTRLEPRHGTRSGSDRPARRAAIGALAVDDHAAGQDQATGEIGLIQLPEQYRGRQVVVPGVVRDVVEPQAETDLGGLMADCIDPTEHVRPVTGIDQVGLDEIRRRVPMAWLHTVYDNDLMPLVGEKVDHVRPDEA